VGAKPKGNPKTWVLSISVDKEDNENIEMVPVKGQRRLFKWLCRSGICGQLPKLYLPMFKQGTYRAFEIKGDSMLPLQSGTIIIGEYQENWADVKAGETYVVISKSDGVVYKRAGNKFKGK
jgi:hypothetical protein